MKCGQKKNGETIMSDTPSAMSTQLFTKNATSAAIQIGLLFLLAAWCIAKTIGSLSRRMYRLNSLAPDIVEAILQNDAPDHLSLRTFYRGIALTWAGQRRQLLGI